MHVSVEACGLDHYLGRARQRLLAGQDALALECKARADVFTPSRSGRLRRDATWIRNSRGGLIGWRYNAPYAAAAWFGPGSRAGAGAATNRTTGRTTGQGTGWNGHSIGRGWSDRSGASLSSRGRSARSGPGRSGHGRGLGGPGNPQARPRWTEHAARVFRRDILAAVLGRLRP